MSTILMMQLRRHFELLIEPVAFHFLIKVSNIKCHKVILNRTGCLDWCTNCLQLEKIAYETWLFNATSN
jgi:hypothetical protein